jgi:hypothetical protein
MWPYLLITKESVYPAALFVALENNLDLVFFISPQLLSTASDSRNVYFKAVLVWIGDMWLFAGTGVTFLTSLLCEWLPTLCSAHRKVQMGSRMKSEYVWPQQAINEVLGCVTTFPLNYFSG